MQSFHAVVKPLGETRPAWKILRVLANLLGVPGFDFDSTEDVLRQVSGLNSPDKTCISAEILNNSTQAAIDLTPTAISPVVARIYELDGIVRRATSLQLTADAKKTETAQEITA